MNIAQTKKVLTGLEVAVIGIMGRFPGAGDTNEFWNNLIKGVESITYFTDEELKDSGVTPQEIENPNYIKSAPQLLEESDCFDSAFFGYTPREAELMDPQMRIFLECAWGAVEDSGYIPDTYNGNIGLYAGAGGHFQWEGIVQLSQSNSASETYDKWVLRDKDFLSTRISYDLNLRGPSVTLYTACSTSLVAVHMACLGLLSGECKIALAGGITATKNKKRGYFYQENMIASRDGHCRPFDSEASGTIFGDGVGVVALKLLKNATSDKDNIYAVIKSTSINNDGKQKVGYTAPSIDGQSEVIRTALRMARVESESITYIETHGTGTALGDPIEIESLKVAFKTEKKQYCAIGSVKSNVGHLDIASGITGFIKTVLALKHRMIPPSLNFKNPNPKIDFENSPFYVNTKLQEWKNDKYPLRAGVSSFGIGGTNAHAILEEAPPFDIEPINKTRDSSAAVSRLILLSAKTTSALDRMTERFINYLRANPTIDFEDAAYTLKVGRKPFKSRKMVVCATAKEAIDILSNPASEAVQTSVAPESRRVIFMFSGQGSQYVDMGLGLYKTEPVFREEIDRCFDILKTIIPTDFKKELYPSPGAATENINQTDITQPILFVFEYALAKLMMEWGIKPFAMIGHSIGEYVAACIAGVFSIEDALKLVALRGKLMKQMPGGDMLSVNLPEKDLLPFLGKELDLAAVNGTSSCVVSGSAPAIKKLVEELDKQGHRNRLLHTSHAFHSRMMDPVLKTFEENVKGISLNKPGIPYISNVTGNWITVEDVMNPGYWATHLRQAVRFSDGLKNLLSEMDAILVEVGPGNALCNFARQHEEKKPGHKIINLVRHPKETLTDTDYLLGKVGQLWLNGAPLNWTKYYAGQRRRRISLPTYPFERQQFPVDSDLFKMIASHMNEKPVNRGRLEINDWFYIPTWKPSPIKVRSEKVPRKWLFIVDEKTAGIGKQIIQSLVNEGEEVVVTSDDDAALQMELKPGGKCPQKIVHLLNLTGSGTGESLLEESELRLEKGFYSLVRLAQAIGKENKTDEIQLFVLSSDMQAVGGESVISPDKAVVLGPVKIIPREYPNIRCSSIDIQVPQPGSRKEERLLNRLIDELKAGQTDPIVAYRSNRRMTQSFEPVPLNEIENSKRLRIREKGIYLITGGLGGIGLVLAEYLAKQARAKLILTARTPLPPRDRWDHWLTTHPVHNTNSARIRKLRELEASGSEILIFNVDVTDYERMNSVVCEAEEKFGKINGVIHAAGLPGGGLIQLKNRETAGNVLSPKVKGTLVLESIFKRRELDFLVLCSSINSVVSFIGQVDYTAANAFLDAFAYYKNLKDDTFTVSINWDAWREVGMAVESAKPEMVELTEPLLDFHVKRGGAGEIFVTHFDFHKHWVLNEHRTSDMRGIIPGTTYLEMAREAVAHLHGPQSVEFRDVHFLTPMMVGENEEREAILELKQEKDEFEFRVKSRRDSNDPQWQTHTMGKIILVEQETQKINNIAEIESRLPNEDVMIERTKDEIEKGILVFGPRWRNRKRVKYGENQSIAFMELNEKFALEVDSYLMHPALLDTATGFYYSLINPKSAYIPFSYKRLRMAKPLPRSIYSYARLIESSGGSGMEMLKFDITIMDEEGKTCLIIDGFTMLEVSEGIVNRIEGMQRQDDVKVKPREEAESKDSSYLKNGILSSEGINAFTRILSGEYPRVVVSTTDLLQRIEAQGQSNVDKITEKEKDISSGGGKYARPELSVPYAEPETETEKMIANIWGELLGIKQVGIHDDFFELGGDSLKAITVGNRIHKQVHTEVPLTEFFSRPTIKKLAEYIDGDLPKKTFSHIEPTEEKEYYILSSTQKRLFVLNRLEENSLAYNLPEIFELGGNIDISSLESSLMSLIQRHEILRTSFHMIEENPVQCVHKTVELHVEYFDITGNEDDAVEKIIRQFIRAFDLGKTPLLRAGVIGINKERQLLMLDFHHIIYDGTSMMVLREEIMRFFNGETLHPLRIQYKDYVQWKNSEEQKAVIKKQEEYWTDEFFGEIPVLSLPYDFPRPMIQTYEGSAEKFNLPGEQTIKLKELFLKEEATLFMGILSVFDILLAKLSGQQDIIVGTPVAGRIHEDLQRLIGLFINSLALRNSPTDEKPFKVFLKEVREKSLASFDRQDYPFEDLVNRLALNRDMGRNPLFDSMFVLHNEFFNARGTNLQEETQKIKPYRFKKRSSQLDISLICFDGGDYLSLEIEYSTKLFKKETILRFIGYFKMIIDSVLNNPEQRLSEIEILSDEEKRQLVMDFNDTQVDYPKDKTIYELFEEQVDKTPHHIAIIGSAQLTYRELNEKSNSLAFLLQEKGAHPETIVGIKMERSIEMIIGIFGILKAGAAYLPIDPDYPQERIDYMIKDSGVKIILGVKISKSSLPTFFQESTVEDRHTCPSEPLNVSTSQLLNFHLLPVTGNRQPATSLAYIIYTSGTTGKPKGMMIEHRNVVRLMKNEKFQFDFNSSDTWTMFHSFGFDFSVWEMFGALLYGGKLLVIPKMVTRDLVRYLEILKRNRVTVLNQTPSAFYHLSNLELNSPGSELRARYVIFGGEALTPSRLKEWKKKYPSTKLINMYGITETTVHVTYKEIEDREIESNISNIGKPIPTLSAYVMGKNLKLQPIGAPGELVVGGEGVGRGYLNRPELSREKFLENPYKARERLYKSGDLAKLLTMGDLQYIGRIDNQVKIRGFRIELGEIENQLLKNKEIKEAVLTVIEDGGGEKNLAAYIVSTREFLDIELRDYLQRELPDYMVPTYFVRMKKIPLTPSGKVDRKALPRPELKTGENYTAPGNVLESKLSELWASVLGIEVGQIGIDANFFELGGHSLRATMLASRIQKALNIHMPLTEIFKRPTIRGLGQYIKEAKEERYASIEPVEKKEYYELTSAQKRLYILSRMEPDNVNYNIPQVIPFTRLIDKEKIESVFKKLIRRHESLRTSFEIIDDEPVQRIHNEVEFKIEYLAGDDLRPFDLSKAPLMRVGIIEENGKSILLVDMSHIITDGTSNEILKNEFIALYEGKREDLPPLRLQYKDYANWQNSEIQQAVMKKIEVYWLKIFEKEAPVLNLPTDYPRPIIQSFEGSTVSFFLDENESKIVRVLAKETEATLYMSILSVFSIFISRVSGQEDIVIGTPVAARRHADLEKIIGMFVNTLAIRNNISGEMSYREFVKELKEQTLNVFENQEYPFETLVEKINAARDISRNPVFDVMLNLLNREENKGEISGINEDGVYTHKKGTSKFDLTLTAVDFGERVYLSFEYCTRLFKPSTIERFISYLKKIVVELSANIDQNLSKIEIITQDEKERILYDFNDTQADYPKDKTIYELFEDQVDKIPDHIALVFDDKVLTFREFDNRANRLSHYLRKEKGVGVGDRIAVLMDRSIEVIITLMGVLKSGGAYVPLDASIPGERIRMVFNDASIDVIVSQQKYLEKLQTFHGILYIDKINDELNRHPVSRPGSGDSNDPAYVMYTSGSSGTPKGVLVKHRTIVNTLDWRRRYYEYGPDNVSLQIPPYFFDSSVTDIFTPLLGGARLVLVKENERVDLEALKHIITKNKVSHYIVVPVFYNVLLEEIPGYLTGLKMITCAGDNFPDELIRKHFERLPNVRIFNEYGPTENSVNTSAYELKPDSPKALIGKPISNVEIYILDRNLNIAPIGVMGEICLAGASLAAGYLNRPELTSEKFIMPSATRNPFEKGVLDLPKLLLNHFSLLTLNTNTFYRTGDMGKWLPDGNLEFLGRVDTQVKIRGIRIETGEIENHLLKRKDIKEAVVLAREGAGEEKYLCAYIVPADQNPVIDMDLKEYLSERLPEYMIPSYFIEIESIPMLPNGKINKELLPVPEISKEAHTAPRNSIEIKLAEIWGDVLATPIETIGIDSDFFKLGGHSLRATILASRVHKTFSAKLPLAEIFKTPTIRGLARYIKEANEERYASIEPSEEREYYPLSPAQKRLFILHRMTPDNTGYNMPQVIPLSMEIEIEKLESAFKELIRRHESLRTSFEMIEGEPAQRIFNEVEFTIEYLTTKWGLRPFDLSKAPLLRVGLIKEENGQNLLLVDMNHIITDGFSQAILEKEFALLYGGKKEELTPLRLQYKDYARWQKSEANRELMKGQESFWLNLFSGEIPALNLPTDYPRPIVQNFEGETEYFTVDELITRSLKEYALAEGGTLYIVVLGAVNILLSRLSGQEDIVIGTPTAGRRHADLEKIIGMFVNTIALRNQPKGEQTINEFIQDVKERTLESFENQEYQFEDLVEKLDIKRDPGRNPLFDVMVVLQNIEGVVAERKGAGYKIETSKFDISITAEESVRGLVFSFQYCTKLFKKETILRFMGYLREIIAGIIESPGMKINQIDIIPEEEKNRLLIEFNNSEKEYPAEKTIHRLFEEQEERTPDHIAIVGSSGQITYRELNEKSDSLAQELMERGIEPGDIVGIKMERSIEMIEAMLGILKAGGAYLPIAPNYPQERIDFIIKDSNTKIIIDKSFYVAFYQTQPAGGIPLTRSLNTNTCYVIYTSGSTGKPKGVIVEHRNVVRLVKNPSFIESKEGQRLLMTGQYTFDIVTFEIWWPLLNGLILIQADENAVLNPEEMGKIVTMNRIDILHLVPQLFNPLFSHNPAIFERLGYFLVGGDLVAPRDIRNLRNKYEKLKILHMYGPTESATFSTYLEVGKLDESDRSLPIGKPVNNSTVYILGNHDEILPIGVVGELCVGGAGVARGYLNNPEMTAERFIMPSATKNHSAWGCNPPFEKGFLDLPKLYRTGDLARWLDDGNIEFLGRMDYQVKIRGIRVELGEIENHLKAHAGIKEVVVVDKNEKGRQYLCGYFVKEHETEKEIRWVEELKKTLEGKLPAYMIPACFVELEKIPLNANGKFDRKALPQPLESDFHSGGVYEAPVNDLQRTIAEIWQEVLGREKVGIQDNFFDIGGNSLDFVKVGSKLKEKLNEEIAIVTLFTYPTISSLAHYLSSPRENESFNENPPDRSELIDEGKDIIFQALKKLEEGD